MKRKGEVLDETDQLSCKPWSRLTLTRGMYDFNYNRAEVEILGFSMLRVQLLKGIMVLGYWLGSVSSCLGTHCDEPARISDTEHGPFVRRITTQCHRLHKRPHAVGAELLCAFGLLGPFLQKPPHICYTQANLQSSHLAEGRP